MIAATWDSCPAPRGGWRRCVPLALLWMPALLWAAAQAPAPAPGQQPPESQAVDGLFITVHHPLTSTAVAQVKDKTNRFLQRGDRRGLKIIYDFNPDGSPSKTADYGPCHDLAEFLLDLQDVTTVAFVHNEVSGHTILPVLACKEIVMSKEATLGDGLRDQAKPLAADKRDFYETVARGRGRCPAVVLKMVDKDMEVLKGTRKDGVWWVDGQRLAEEKRQGFIPQGSDPAFSVGSTKIYKTPEAQKFSLCNLVRESRPEVAQAYQLPPRALREDPLEGRTPMAWHIEVKGPVNGALRETLERRIPRAVHRGANLIILQLQCGGGDIQVAYELADFLRNLKDDKKENPVMTVAYVTQQARDTAAFLAFGCSEIVMEKSKRGPDQGAKLGGFEAFLHAHPNHERAIYDLLEDLAQKQGYSPLLVQGMLNYRPDKTGDFAVYRVRSVKGQPERRLMDGDELEQDKKGERRWQDEGLLKPLREYLTLGPDRAVELKVAEFAVEKDSSREALQEIANHYGVEKLNEAGPDWLDELSSFLRQPTVAVFLVMVGIIGLILELKMPGIGFPGVVSAICFVLFFWAQSQLTGNLWMLAVLLFVLGLILIGLEVFVVPGFGITGVSGIVLVVVSLALATLLKKPETTREWLEFGTTLSSFGLSLVGAVVLAFALVWYLPHIPYANRLVLAPPPDQTPTGEGEGLATGPEKNMFALLGAIGEAATTLRPAGKARFGDEFVDVVAEGSYVRPGARVQVIEIEGNRVVVKEV